VDSAVPTNSPAGQQHPERQEMTRLGLTRWSWTDGGACGATKPEAAGISEVVEAEGERVQTVASGLALVRGNGFQHSSKPVGDRPPPTPAERHGEQDG
jgi:hypothetical protein